MTGRSGFHPASLTGHLSWELQSPRFDEVGTPIGGIQAVGSYSPTRGRGVHETTLTDVDAHM